MVRRYKRPNASKPQHTRKTRVLPRWEVESATGNIDPKELKAAMERTWDSPKLNDARFKARWKT